MRPTKTSNPSARENGFAISALDGEAVGMGSFEAFNAAGLPGPKIPTAMHSALTFDGDVMMNPMQRRRTVAELIIKTEELLGEFF